MLLDFISHFDLITSHLTPAHRQLGTLDLVPMDSCPVIGSSTDTRSTPGRYNSATGECSSERRILLSSAFPPVKRVRTWRICSLQPTGDVLVKFGGGGQCSSLIGRYSSGASGPVSSVSGRNECVRSLHGCVLSISCFHYFPICDTCCEALTTSGGSHLGSVLPHLPDGC